MKGFKEFLKEWRRYIGVMGLLLFFVYGSQIFNSRISIDTEQMINMKNGFFFGWLKTGRQGLVALIKLLNLQWFSPYFIGVLAFLSVILCAVTWSYYLYVTSNHSCKKESLFLFSMAFMTCPILVESYYFQLMNFETMFGMAMTAVALLWLIRFLNGEGIRYALLGILLSVWCFSVYQALVPFYISGAAIGYINVLRTERKNPGEHFARHAWKMAIEIVGLFLIAYIVNTLITKIWFSGSAYLAQMVAWGNKSIKEIIINVYGYIKTTLLGKEIYYSVFNGLFLAGYLIIILKELYGSRKGGSAYAAANFILVISPFMLALLIGGVPMARTQYVLPLVTAYYACICLDWWEPDKKIGKYVVVLLGCVMIWNQSQMAARMFYTEDVRYEEDVRLAEAISEDIDRQIPNANEMALVFVGSRDAELNNACVRGEMIGQSVFSWDTDEIGGSSIRIIGFMKTLGMVYQKPSEEIAIAARKTAADMPCWPREGSICQEDGFVIIKLSESRDSFFENKRAEKIEINNEIQELESFCFSIDGVDIGEEVVIQGWAGVQNEELAQLSLVLRNRQTGEYIKLPTLWEKREDVYDMFEGKVKMECGFYSRIRQEEVFADGAEYEIGFYYEGTGGQGVIMSDASLTKK